MVQFSSMRIKELQISLFGIHKGDVPAAVRWARKMGKNKPETSRNVAATFENLRQEIIANQLPTVFLSPHFDDAVFSAGNLMASLAEANPDNTHLVTIFSQAGGGKAGILRRSLLSSYESPQHLYAQRQGENQHVAQILGVKTHEMGFVDAAWRENPSRRRNFFNPNHLSYPFNTFLLGHVRKREQTELTGQITSEIAKYLEEVGQGKRVVVFAPVAVKGLLRHVDHILARDSVVSIQAEVVYYADYPYDVYGKPDSNFIKNKHVHPVVYDGDKNARKRDAILAYTSQIPLLFSKSLASPVDAVPGSLPHEVYFI